jgi:glycosyltransferase involved in cell wall biosynthesis
VKIAISALLYTSSADHRQTGICRYIHMLVSELLKLESGHRFCLFLPSSTVPPESWQSTPGVEIVPVDFANRRRRLMWEHFKAGTAAKRVAADVWFSTAQSIPLSAPCPRVVMIHDLIPVLFPQYVSRGKAVYQKWALRHAIRNADAILANSETTKRDIVAFGSDRRLEGKVTVTYLGPGNRLEPSTQAMKPTGVRFEKFLFWLGALEPRKNLEGIVKAFDELRRQNKLPDEFGVVIGGGKGVPPPEVAARLAETGLADRFQFAGFIPDAELPTYMSSCEAFIYPSLYEGFGMPVLEAMIAGAPVLASNQSAIQEVGGDAPLYFDPSDPASIARAIEELIQTPALRADRIEKGFARAQRFSWRRCAEQTLEVLDQFDR